MDSPRLLCWPMEGLDTQIPGYAVRALSVDGLELPLGSLFIFSSD